MAAQPGELSAARSAVRVRRLQRRFGTRTVLDGVDLELAPGEFAALLGRSGSGKSTLLRALAGLEGSVGGSGELQVPQQRAVIFQDTRLLPWARALDNVVLGLHGPEARERGAAALAEVGLGGREGAWPVELSGGEQQRVALARALVREPDLLLADEPFGALDSLTRARMHVLLRQLCERHRPAVLLVTHDVDEALALASRALVLSEGRIAVDQPLGSPQARRPAQRAELREVLLAALGEFPELGPERSNLPTAREGTVL